MSRSLAALVIGNSKYKKAGKLKNPACKQRRSDWSRTRGAPGLCEWR